MSVLDLPIEKQHELAQRMGMTHSAWVKEIQQDLAESDTFLKKVQKIEASGGRMSEEQRKLFQDKMNSAHPT